MVIADQTTACESRALVTTGSAFALGACPAVTAEKIRKSRKAFTYADFRGFKKTQKRVDFAFDHSLSHFYAKTIKNRIKSGCGAVGSARHLGC